MKKGSQSDAMGMTIFTEGETTANADHVKVKEFAQEDGIFLATRSGPLWSKR